MNDAANILDLSDDYIHADAPGWGATRYEGPALTEADLERAERQEGYEE